MSSSISPAQRYATIDALRGVAALSVAVYHLVPVATSSVTGALTEFLQAAASLGFVGVPIFFIISGFVIAATNEKKEINFNYVRKFAAKRMIRLDPPYWLSILIDLTLLWLAINVFRQSTKNFPTLAEIFSHFFYVQDVLGVEQIAGIYWTLCLEVQFYLIFIMTFAIDRLLWVQKIRKHGFAEVALWIAFVYSIAIVLGVGRNPIKGLFLSHWYLFMMGVVTFWAFSRRGAYRWMFGAACLALVSVVIFKWIAIGSLDFFVVAGVGAALFIWLAGAFGKLNAWLNIRPLMFLGSISYSLYLFHAIVGERVINFIYKVYFVSRSLHEWQAVLVLVGAVFISMIFSYIVFRTLERPSMSLSQKIRPGAQTGLLCDMGIVPHKEEVMLS